LSQSTPQAEPSHPFDGSEQSQPCIMKSKFGREEEKEKVGNIFCGDYDAEENRTD
jgi:hypothetical protein